MCGIVGFVHHDRNRPPDERRLVAMRDVIAHRGPDDAGLYSAPGIGLGSRRLAILDLSERGHMPMSTTDGRFHIIYNGEVYNYRALRETLIARGVVFRSNTDTEVLLHLYALEGVTMLERLNGMFALAIWDATERCLFLARDRLGVKPLYYALQVDGFYFASEQKALFLGGVPAHFDPTVWEELLCFRYVAGESTPFQGVRRLLPGHYLLLKNGETQIRRWWNLGERTSLNRLTLVNDPVTWFRQTFDEAVDLRRISDVPVGVMLSGGLDSSSIAASIAGHAGSTVASFTVRFKESGYDEGSLVRLIVDRYGLEPHELYVSEDELVPRLSRASWFNDEPLAHASSLHIAALSAYAKPRVTVLLSGEGADETLGGYVRYRPLQYSGLFPLLRAMLPATTGRVILPSRVRKLGGFLALGTTDQFVLMNSCDVLPKSLEAVGLKPVGLFPYRAQLLDDARALYSRDPMRQAMFIDQHTFLCSVLDRNDRMTMSASMECRVPFLDYRLVEGLAALPSNLLVAGRRNKPLLRKALGDRLPPRVLSGRKWGFGVPWTEHFRRHPQLRELVGNLPGHKLVTDGPFDCRLLRSVVRDFLSGSAAHEGLIYQLAMTVAWHDAYFPRLTQILQDGVPLADAERRGSL